MAKLIVKWDQFQRKVKRSQLDLQGGPTRSLSHTQKPKKRGQ